MTAENQGQTNPRSHSAQADELERALDAALAKYAAAEPRAGFEDRILANLQSEQRRLADRTWLRWGLAAAAVAVVVVGIALAWRPDRPSHSAIANHPSITTPAITTPAPKEPSAQVASNTGNVARPQRRGSLPRVVPSPRTVGVVATAPKLDQFPSPQPLSEQEKLLWNYVAQHPERAGLVAEARMESLERDAEERRQLAAGQPDSQQ